MTEHDTELAVVPESEGGIDLPKWNVHVAVALDGGQTFIPITPICAALGLDGTQQIRRIKRHTTMARYLRAFRLMTPKGPRPTQCINMRVLGFWLGTVGIEHVRADLREWMTELQDDVIEAASIVFAAHIDERPEAARRALTTLRQQLARQDGDMADAWRFMKMLERRLGHLEDQTFDDEPA